MTYDDDFLLVKFNGGNKHLTCKGLGIDWPPPPLIDIAGFVFKRTRMSVLTDEERSECSGVMRGAEYIPS